MAASEVDQRRYLASRDTDFRKISLADQDAFLRYVTGKGVEHGPWEDDGGATRNVEFPASVFRWFRPESEGTDWDTRFIRFAGDIADARILTAFESNLRRRPMFSIRGTLSSHLLLFLGGVTLLLAGATGDCLLLARLRKSRREARVLPT